MLLTKYISLVKSLQAQYVYNSIVALFIGIFQNGISDKLGLPHYPVGSVGDQTCSLISVYSS